MLVTNFCRAVRSAMAHRESGVCIALVLGIIVTTRSGGRGGVCRSRIHSERSQKLHPPYREEWCAAQKSSTRQHNKILVSGTIGAFGSKRGVTEHAQLLPGTELQHTFGLVPTENTVSDDTLPLSLFATANGVSRRHPEVNPLSQQRYAQPPSY